jgi:hypothetical protein
MSKSQKAKAPAIVVRTPCVFAFSFWPDQSVQSMNLSQLLLVHQWHEHTTINKSRPFLSCIALHRKLFFSGHFVSLCSAFWPPKKKNKIKK